ncbi:MAG: hypothetical protein ABGW74_03270 [Campylobacterales bacterium]
MSIGAIGNAVYVNQQAVSISNVQNAHNNRIELQNVIAQTIVNEKDEKVLEVRPTEDNQEVDADREHQKNEADQKTKNKKSKDKGIKEDEKSEYDVHSLDIKV